jgi:hypothetical protein
MIERGADVALADIENGAFADRIRDVLLEGFRGNWAYVGWMRASVLLEGNVLALVD